MTAPFEFPDVSIPEGLRRAAARYPRHPAVMFQGRTIDGYQTDKQTGRGAGSRAAELRALAAEPPDTTGTDS